MRAAEEAVQNAADRTCKPQGCVRNCKTDAILTIAGHRTMIEIGVGDGDVATAIATRDIVESAAQNQRDFRTLMGMGGNATAPGNPKKRRFATIAFADPVLTHARKLLAPLQVGNF